MRRFACVAFAVMLATPARGQSSLSACGPLPDSTSRQMIKVYDGVRVCLLATRVVGTEAELPHEWAARGVNVIMETQRTGDNRRASIAGDRVAWTINGQLAPIDSMADRWQKSVLELLDASYETEALRTEAADLRTEIDSLPSRKKLTRAKIDLIERKQRELDMQLMRVQSQESRITSDISRLERQRQDVQSRASAEERRAASARDEATRQSAQANAQRLYGEAQRIDAQISGLYSEERRSDASRQVARLREELRGLNGDNNVALLRMKLANYDSSRVEDLEAQLTQLDAQRRLPALEARVETARVALLAVLDARGKAPSR